MKVVYTQSPGREKGVCYRLPSPFFGVISGATEVIVDGDYPHIVEAYERAGKTVSKPGDNEDDERREFLMDEIEKATGTRPGARSKTETLEQKYAELTEQE